MTDPGQDERDFEPADSPEQRETSPVPEPPADAQQTPLDLEQMEADIRERLKQIVSRARQAETDARALIERVRPILRTQKAIVKLTDAENRQIAALSTAAQQVSLEHARMISDLAARIQREITFRRELVAGRDDAWQQYESTVFASADAWFRAVGQRHAGLRKRMDALGVWLRSREKRWSSRQPVGKLAGKPASRGP